LYKKTRTTTKSNSNEKKRKKFCFLCGKYVLGVCFGVFLCKKFIL